MANNLSGTLDSLRQEFGFEAIDQELNEMKNDDDIKRKRAFIKAYKDLCHTHKFMMLGVNPVIIEYNIGDFHDMENEICKTL